MWVIGAALIASAMGVPLQSASSTIYEYCIPGPFVLTFRGPRTRLGKQNRAILDNIVSQARGCGRFLIIDAFPSASGSEDIGFSRAQIAIRYLIGRRILSSDIRLRLHHHRRASDALQKRWDVEIAFYDGVTAPENGS
jgi:hypothetical protein